MKNLNIIILVFTSISVSAQPVFQNADERPGQAYTAAVRTGTFSGGPGSAGVNQVWDFRSMVFGSSSTLIVLNTNNNLYKNTYPTANFVYIIDSAYNYFIVNNSKMEQVTYNINAPGGISDYAQNPKTIMEFPFSWHVQFNDTYMGYGDSTRTVTVRYDGYGTLKMPNGDYTNVARVSETYSTGVDYVWYSEKPFLPILRYRHMGSLFTQIITSTAAIHSSQGNTRELSVYPNPVSNQVTFSIDLAAGSSALLRVYDITGRLVLEDIITRQHASFDVSRYPSGMYVYKIIQAGNTVTGKFNKR